MGRRTVAGAALAALAAGVAVTANAVTGPSVTIRHRFEHARYPIYEFPGGSSIRPTPQDAFYTVDDYGTSHGFWFMVYVYATPAQASAAVDRFEATVHSGSSQLVQRGRVLYEGATGPLNRTQGPPATLPSKDFLRDVGIAEGR